MHALRSVVLLGFVAAAISACGDSHKNPPGGGNVRSMAGAAASPIEEGGTGAEQGEAGAGVVEAGGVGGTAGRAGAGGMGATGGGGAPSAGGMSAAGAGPAAGASGGGAPGGGAPGGGAPGAGASSMAGAGGATLMEAPPNCQSVRQAADAETCAFEYTCDKRTHYDSCSRDSDGVWACECGTFSTPTRYFELEGVEGLAACGLIAHICESDVPVSPLRTCRTKDGSVEDGTCWARATCGYALELGPDIVGRIVEEYRSACEPTDYWAFTEGGFSCSCRGGAFDREPYLLTAPSIDTLCKPMLDFCTAEQPPVYTDRVCGASEPSGVVEQACPMNPDCQGCVMTLACGPSAPLDVGVSIVGLGDSPYRSVACRPDQGVLQCTCETVVDGVYGDESVPAATLERCRDALEVCPP